ncbi:unnamed protein product, partial [Durusdinium trenchii]
GLRRGMWALCWNVKSCAHEMALQKVEQTRREAQRSLLKACWAALLRFMEQSQLMILYLSWADAKRLRTRVTSAFHAWFAWYQRKAVPRIQSEAQVLASWRWIRVTRSTSSTSRFAPASREQTDVATWWHAAAAGLLYGLAPFDVHPHRIKAVRENILTIFASALLKKMMAAWTQEVQSIRSLLQQAKQREKHRWMDAWEAATAKCRDLHQHQLLVSNQRCKRTVARAMLLWEQRWSKLVQHRRSLQEFDVACWHRICRRAMDAWIRVLQWKALAQRHHRASRFKLQCWMFQVWVTLWQAKREEALLTRQVLHRFRLQRGERALQQYEA